MPAISVVRAGIDENLKQEAAVIEADAPAS